MTRGLRQGARRVCEEIHRGVKKGDRRSLRRDHPGAVDYSAVVQKIKRADAEAVIYGGYHPEASSIVAQMRKKGMKIFFISDDGVKDDTFIKVAQKYAEGVYATGPRDTTKNPLAISAIEAHKKAYGADPGAFFLNGVAATQAILNAMQKAGSTDYAAVGQALQTQFVETPLGKIKFDKRGMRSASASRSTRSAKGSTSRSNKAFFLPPP